MGKYESEEFRKRMQDYGKENSTQENVIRLANYRKNEEIYKEEELSENKKSMFSFKKALAIGVVMGGAIGVPVGISAYNDTLNLPSAYNYTTVKEKRENLKHDTTNYEKYLKQKGYSSKEIQEKLKEWDEKMKMEKRLTSLVESQENKER